MMRQPCPRCGQHHCLYLDDADPLTHDGAEMACLACGWRPTLAEMPPWMVEEEAKQRRLREVTVQSYLRCGLKPGVVQSHRRGAAVS